jgi:hypothetical protein
MTINDPFSPIIGYDFNSNGFEKPYLYWLLDRDSPHVILPNI